MLKYEADQRHGISGLQRRRSSILHRMRQPLSPRFGGDGGSDAELRFTSARCREPDPEAASGRNHTIHFDGGSMRGADGLDNRQSEPHTTAVAGPRIVHTVEPIKQVRQGAWRNTDPGVPDFEHTLPTGFDRF